MTGPLEQRYGPRAVESLNDIVSFAEDARVLMSRGKAAYDEDVLLRRAGEAIIHRLGEAVSRLPDDLRTNHPRVNWRGMRAMGNLVAHVYHDIDHHLVWNALADSLPADLAEIRGLLGEELDEPDG